MKRTNIFLTPQQRAKLFQRSKQSGAPVAALVRRAIDEYLSVAAAKRPKAVVAKPTV
jgi:hypothetical protein